MHISYTRSDAASSVNTSSGPSVSRTKAGIINRLALALIAITTCGIAAAQPTGGVYQVTNLISDAASSTTPAANVIDSKFINPWAISASGTWWISTEGSGYNYIVSSTTTPVPPATYNKVTVPAAGTTNPGFPTGSVTTGGSPATALILSNGTKATFLFSTLDGTISGWNGPIGQTGTSPDHHQQ